jgi:hypothetical protein
MARRKKAAKALKGIVHVAAVDADAHRELGTKYGVQVSRPGRPGRRPPLAQLSRGDGRATRSPPPHPTPPHPDPRQIKHCHPPTPQGFPTIKLMHADASGRAQSVDYAGQRGAKEIVTWALQQAQAIALKRIGAAAGGAGAGGGGENGGCRGGPGAGGGGGGGGFYAGTGKAIRGHGRVDSCQPAAVPAAGGAPPAPNTLAARGGRTYQTARPEQGA